MNMPSNRFYVIAYDIQDDRQRRQASRVLLAHGERVQKSLYECELKPAALQKIQLALQPLYNPEQDRLRLYRLCAQCLKHTQTYGQQAAIATLPDFWLV